MVRTTIRTRVRTVVLMMLLPTLAGVVLAQNQPQPDSRLPREVTLEDLVPVAFHPAEAAPKAAAWFRITFDWVGAEGGGPLTLADTKPAPTSKENVPVAPPPVQVPEAVQNLRRADR